MIAFGALVLVGLGLLAVVITLPILLILWVVHILFFPQVDASTLTTSVRVLGENEVIEEAVPVGVGVSAAVSLHAGNMETTRRLLESNQ